MNNYIFYIMRYFIYTFLLSFNTFKLLHTEANSITPLIQKFNETK